MFRPPSRRTLSILAALALAPAAAWTGCARARAAPAGGLAALRGDFQERVLLTGELQSQRAIEVKVPQTRVFRLALRAVVPDGTPVAAGQVVAEFDNSQFTSDLEDKRLQLAEKESDLASQRAQAESDDAQRAFDVEEKRAALDKARIQAAVPRGLLAEREREERQLALRRAEVELAKSQGERAAHRGASAADLAIKRIDLARQERELAEAQRAIGELALRAPSAGIALLGEDPWEGRKVRAGDELYGGQTVVRLPDLASLEVQADLSDVDDGRVRPGMPARLTLDAYPGRSYAGRVVAVSPVARESARSPLLRSFRVRIALLERDPARLRPGLSVKVEALGPARRGAILAPRAALDLASRPPRALLAAGGTTPVELGACDPQRCVVLSGLAAGARLRPFTPAAGQARGDEGAAG
jgi:multidrug resistance efflux pump